MGICSAAAEARGTAESSGERAQIERRGAEHSETDPEPNPRQAVRAGRGTRGDVQGQLTATGSKVCEEAQENLTSKL